jgi:hypothetical protein
MTRTLRIATVVLLVLAGVAFRRWDLYRADPGHPRYIHTSAHGWAGGPDILQLTAVVWLASTAVICLVLSLREKLSALISADPALDEPLLN